MYVGTLNPNQSLHSYDWQVIIIISTWDSKCNILVKYENFCFIHCTQICPLDELGNIWGNKTSSDMKNEDCRPGLSKYLVSR